MVTIENKGGSAVSVAAVANAGDPASGRDLRTTTGCSRIRSMLLLNNNGNQWMYYFWLNWGGTNNNGNLLQFYDEVGNAVPYSSLTVYAQNFGYDGLNRIASASETVSGNPNPTWSRSFSYDRFGNAWVPSASGMGYGVSTPAWNVYNSTTNQVSSSPYDANGNIAALPPGYSFTYDAENRVAAETSSNTHYYYDGLGQRVEKTVGSTATVFVYDAFGQLAEEYSPATTWSKDYVRYLGQVVAVENASGNPCSTCYLHFDHLGTVRMVANQSGGVVGRHDYLPFGDEIPGGAVGRNSQFGPYADNVSQKFTGQYRDLETLNDAFPARYYTAPLMRFLTPDPAGLGAVDPSDPQTWNQYTYVRNNPLALVDPSGMGWRTTDVTVCTAVVSSSITFTSGDSFSTIFGGPTYECHSETVWTWVPDPGPGSGGGSSGGGGGGGGDSENQQPPKSGAQRLACAANFGQNHSIAAAFGAQNNFVANLFGGNSVSGLVNLGLFVSGDKTPTASQLAAIPLKGAAQGIPVPPGNPGLSGATGQLRGIAVQGAVSGAYNAIAGVGAEPIELGITAAGTVATPVAQLGAETLSNVAFGVGVAKFLFDLSTVGYGYFVTCK